MPKITPKSPELLQAQVAAFTAEREDIYIDEVDGDYIFKNLGCIAAGNVIGNKTLAKKYGQNREQGAFPTRTEILIASGEKYVEYLRSVGGAAYDGISGRAGMLERYNEEFKPIISGLLDELSTMCEPESHRDFIGGGDDSNVFRFSHYGKDYAVRVPISEQHSAVTIDDHLSGPILGRGIPHLEHIVAASYEDGVTIAELIPGKAMYVLSTDEMRGVTDRQLEELIDTFETVNESGILIDPNSGNFLYDPEVGFGIVDYWSYGVGDNGSIPQDLSDVVSRMTVPIMSSGCEIPCNPAERFRVNYGVLTRYKAIIEQKLDPDDCLAAMTGIEEHFADYMSG